MAMTTTEYFIQRMNLSVGRVISMELNRFGVLQKEDYLSSMAYLMRSLSCI
jgi:hypothetical protein